MRRNLALLTAFTSALVVLVAAPGAAANDTQCIGTLTGTHDNVVVPPGQSCILNGATVLGNVKALQDSRLRVQFSNVRGNVVGDKADVVQVVSSRVREDISITEGGPAAPPAPGFTVCAVPATGGFGPCEASVTGSTIEEGNIQIEKMQGTILVAGNGLLSPVRGNILLYENVLPVTEFFTVLDNTVTQNMQIFKTRGAGQKTVMGNTVGENLQCFENDPPFVGSPNVARQAQGQCTAAPLP